MTTPEPAATPPAPAPAAPAAPGKGITIAGIVFAFLIPLLGLILSIVGLVQNRNAGQKIGANIAGIVISIVWPIVLSIIIFSLASAFGTCTVTVNGVATAC